MKSLLLYSNLLAPFAEALTLAQPASTSLQQRNAYAAIPTDPTFAAEPFENVILGRQVTFSNPTCGYIGKYLYSRETRQKLTHLHR